MRLIYVVAAVACLVLTVHAQSQDEEEMVHFEGSANAPTDDEDIVEGSGSPLPPDHPYAVNPVTTKLTSASPTTVPTREQATSTHPRQTTTLVKQQKVSPYQTTSTTRISTRPPNDDGTVAGTSANMQPYVVIGIIVILALFIGIILIICCKKQKKAGYAPAKQTLDT